MNYLVTFMEGVITFISPCLLPMLPIYLLYFTGNNKESEPVRVWLNALAFVLGFTIIFTLLGAFAGTLGWFLQRYQTIVNLVTGGIVVLLGLNFMGILKLRLPVSNGIKVQEKPLGFFSTLFFGMIFALGWTPCIGAFLGSALLLASQQASVFKGISLLLAYSLGLGIPFILSAILIDKLKKAFDLVKKYYRPINLISGILLVIIGILMMFGLLGRLLTLLSF
ncbi:Thiol:disulfide interchange protein DsbD [bioreactor metagenome]|uniref:Thiol:disulfide interchange protein DsbD n=1 Tax=bioreactor metagenome TaxID=1076179 RepID=A0A645EN41_9ZZZZ